MAPIDPTIAIALITALTTVCGGLFAFLGLVATGFIGVYAASIKATVAKAGEEATKAADEQKVKTAEVHQLVNDRMSKMEQRTAELLRIIEKLEIDKSALQGAAVERGRADSAAVRPATSAVAEALSNGVTHAEKAAPVQSVEVVNPKAIKVDQVPK